MRSCFSFLALIAVLAGCQGPIMTGGFNDGTPYRSMGVDGPGPGVVPESYQPTSLQSPGGPGLDMMVGQVPGPVDPGAPIMPGPMGPGCPPMMGSGGPPMGPMMGSMPCPPMGMGCMPMMGPTSQINFIGPEGMTVYWDARMPGAFDSEPCILPATKDFGQGKIYRLKITNIPGRQGKELYPTLEIAPTMARTQAFLAHNTIPIEWTDNDFDQVFSGNFITKVVYLPNPEYQGLAMAGVGTLVNTQLEPGVDPIVEASNRGAILAVIRMGNKDLGASAAAQAKQRKAMMQAMGIEGAPEGGVMMMPQQGMMPGMMPQGGGVYPVGGSGIPQNYISGVNIQPYGTPMTKTTSGIPGPPQLPQGMHSPNRYPVVRTEPIPAPPTAQKQFGASYPGSNMQPGVEPQNVAVNPYYNSQMMYAQQQQAQMQAQMQQAQQDAQRSAAVAAGPNSGPNNGPTPALAPTAQTNQGPVQVAKPAVAPAPVSGK